MMQSMSILVKTQDRKVAKTIKKQGKDLKISDIKTKSKDNDKGSRFKGITNSMKRNLQPYNEVQSTKTTDLNDKSNLINLMKECHNKLTSGEIVSLKILSLTMEVHDIIELVISCETAKATWTYLVHNFKGPSNTKENGIMDLKLEYQTFRVKPSKSLSQTNTRYKTLLNELANDGVTLSSEIKVNKGLVAKTFNWDKEEVLDDEEETHVKVLIALADDELLVGKNHACNGEWIDIAMKKVNILLSMDENFDWQTYLKYINIDLKDDLLVLKQAKLETVTFQIQNTKLTKLNHALQDQLKEERKVERLNPDSKHPNFNTRRILVPKSQAINECLQLTKESADPESSKESGSEPQTPLPLLKKFFGAFQA
ncbi:hypothetical protein Tco_0543647 [Tanacetum coccineum]